MLGNVLRNTQYCCPFGYDIHITQNLVSYHIDLIVTKMCFVILSAVYDCI